MLFIPLEKSGMVNIIGSSLFSLIRLLQLVIDEAPSSMVVLGLKIAVSDLFLILFIKAEILCRRFVPLSNSKIFNQQNLLNVS